MPARLLLLALVLAACDSGTSASDADALSVVEGTYTFPDGTTGDFRERGYARGYESARASPQRFVFGVLGVGGPEEPDVRVGVRFVHYGVVTPQPARYGNLASGIGDVFGWFSLRPVPGLGARDLNDSSFAAVDFPEGELAYTWDADGVVRGTFALSGQPFGTDESVRVAVRGRFEIAVPR